MLDRDKLRALGFKIVEPDDESQATVIFTSKEAVEAVRRRLRGGTAATGQEHTKTDPKRPSVRYYVYSAVDGTPVGMLRVIRDETEMQIDRVGKNGAWDEDNAALQDIYPVNEDSLWSQTDEVTEECARQRGDDPTERTVACASVLSPERVVDLSGTSNSTPSLYGTGHPSGR